jgi:excisionase family DNA binding protein
MVRVREDRTPREAGAGGLTAEEVNSLLSLIPTLVAGVGELRQLLTGHSKPFYTFDEFAELTGRAPYTVRTWVKEGLIEATRVEGTGPRGRLLIPREQLEKLVRTGRAGRVPAAALD